MQIDFEGDRAMMTSTRRREPRPWLQLVSSVLTLAGDQAQLLQHCETPWASVTFSGTRHRVRLQFHGNDGAEAAEAFIAALPDHEFAMPGKLVADATISEVTQIEVPARSITVEAELLLLDEG